MSDEWGKVKSKITVEIRQCEVWRHGVDEDKNNYRIIVGWIDDQIDRDTQQAKKGGALDRAEIRQRPYPHRMRRGN